MHFYNLENMELMVMGILSYSFHGGFWFQVKTGILSQIPLGDFGDPIDIAEATAFLACERYCVIYWVRKN